MSANSARLGIKRTTMLNASSSHLPKACNAAFPLSPQVGYCHMLAHSLPVWIPPPGTNAFNHLAEKSEAELDTFSTGLDAGARSITSRLSIGGSVLQMPASADVVQAADLRETFEDCFATPAINANDRLKLFKLAWDLIGSEFAGRHMLYEKFYAGNSMVVRNQSDREAPWDHFHGTVERLLDGISLPG
jgi:hypothetical protein